MYFDTIADYLTRIRNAQMAQHRMVEVPASNIKKSITEILYKQGYILKYKFEDEGFGKQGKILIALKYDGESNPTIKSIKRASKPGKRMYKNSKEIPYVLNGLGIAIISTSKGVMTDKEAREQNVGGEILCEIY